MRGQPLPEPSAPVLAPPRGQMVLQATPCPVALSPTPTWVLDRRDTSRPRTRSGFQWAHAPGLLPLMPLTHPSLSPWDRPAGG